MSEKKFDYKKSFRDLYQPKETPSLIDVPGMRFILVEGKGNPNEENGAYQRAVEAVYSLSYTIKMAKDKPEGYFPYVIPPLEGFWWMEGREGVEYDNKNQFCWTAMIRQPEFVMDEVFARAKETCLQKKPEVDTSKAKLYEFTEGVCVQVLHIGSFDDEPATVARMEEFIERSGVTNDIGSVLPDGMIRRHHEIYLSDPRRSVPEKRKTVLRVPVRSV